MLDIVSEFADHRAKFAREALASSQGDALPDRYKNLSQHQKAELFWPVLGEEIPTVQGANSIRTEAYNARARARREEAALGSESDNIPWCAERRKKEPSMPRRHVDALWDKAYRLSKKSWHPMEPRKNRGSLRKPYTRILAATKSAPSRVPSASL